MFSMLKPKGSLLLLILTLLISQSYAVKYESKKKFIKRNLPAGAKMIKKSFKLTPAKRKELAKAWNWEGDVKKLTYIIAKDKDGFPLASIYLTTLYATEHECIHKIGVALDADGGVKEVVIFELFCDLAHLL